MDTSTLSALALTRRDVLKTCAWVVGLSIAGTPAAIGQVPTPPRRTLALTEVDSFLALRPDGSAIIYSGKVDLGTGHRIAMRQMVGEELSLPVQRIDLIEGDSALTPNQGPTAGSSGVMRGGVELRQAAATLRAGLLLMAAERLKKPIDSLTLTDGVILASDGTRVSVGELAGERHDQADFQGALCLRAR